MADLWYDLNSCPRLTGFPFRLQMVGWLVNHRLELSRRVMANNYICISFNWRKYDKRLPVGHASYASCSFLPIGTVIEGGSKQSYRDEIDFSYSSDVSEHLFRLFHTSKPWRIECFTVNEEMRRIMHEIRMKADCLKEPGVADTIDVLAIQLICAIIIGQQQPSAVKDYGRMNLYNLAAELRQGADLNALIRKSGVGQRTFYNEWKKEFGVSPVQYRLREGIRQARELLAGTALPIKAISQQCHFASLVYFYQCFREQTGVSPAKYRRMCCADGGGDASLS